MNERYLLEKGFKQYKPLQFDTCNKCYQKCYRGFDGSKKYFIDVEYYDLTHPYTHEQLGGYEISTQLYRKGTHDAINMTFLNDDLDDAINTIETMFASGLLEPYEE
jgi:hypothetical protein